MKRRARPQERFTSPVDYIVALFAIFVMGLALRLHGLGSEILWWDEVYENTTMSLSGPLEIIRLSAADNNPPLFYRSCTTGCFSPGTPRSRPGFLRPLRAPSPFP
jgi:hypothetical protein